MPEEKVTEEKVTEEKAAEVKPFDSWIYEVDSGKLVKLHALMNECVSLARETVEAEFGDLASIEGDSLGKLTIELAIALFHKASIPDQTETMLAALERGLEWYGQWQEKQKAESAKIDDAFRVSIQEIIPPRVMTPVESLLRSLLDFASRYSEMELRELFDKPGDVPEAATCGDVPTPEE